MLPKHVEGLLRCEWLRNRAVILGLVALWLLGLALLIFFHPGFIIALGALAAMLLAMNLGGADAAEGAEEFAFSLPPTRAERYLARAGLGLAVVLGLTVAGALSIALDLPQLAWKLFVETGFTEPFPRVEHRCAYALAVAIPFALFNSTFFSAAVSRTRGGVGWSWLLGALATVAVIIGGVIGEQEIWGDANGYITVPALVLLGVGSLALGFVLYRRKEGIARPTPVEARGRAWLVFLVAAIVAVFLLLGLFWARESNVRTMEQHAMPPAQAPAGGGR